MTNYFLREDFEELNGQIEAISTRVAEIGQEMGDSCQEGAETFHDNFAFEDGERQCYMLARRLRELLAARRRATIVEPGDMGRVRIGSRVRCEDVETGEERTVTIGSYMVFRNGDSISYRAPLARLLLGAEEGEDRTGTIQGRHRTFTVLEIR